MTSCKQWIKTIKGDLRLLEKTIRDGDTGIMLEHVSGLRWAADQLEDCMKKKKR